MSTQGNQVIDSVVRGFCQAAETNLKLQQEMLAGWTRFWPGFTGRPVESTAKPLGVFGGSVEQLTQQWADSIRNATKVQRELVDQQFEAAMAMIDVTIGAATKTNGSASATEATSPAPPAAKAAARAPTASVPEETPMVPMNATKNIKDKVAVVTGAASGIGEAVARELANRNAKAVMLVDRSDATNELAASINKAVVRSVAYAAIGDTTDESFRKKVFNEAQDNHGIVSIVVPAAGITRDSLAVRVNKETGKAEIYPVETFRQVAEVNLLAPIYWGMEMVARIAEDRAQRGLKRWEPAEMVQGAVVFLGSVSSQGNKGQISYAVTKAGLEGAAATLTKEAMFYGVRCAIIHPGFTDTPMARALGDEFLNKYVLPYTQLRRLIQPEEIADAICFMISNSAVSGELWADAGWHPPA